MDTPPLNTHTPNAEAATYDNTQVYATGNATGKRKNSEEVEPDNTQVNEKENAPGKRKKTVEVKQPIRQPQRPTRQQVSEATVRVMASAAAAGPITVDSPESVIARKKKRHQKATQKKTQKKRHK